MIKWFKRYFRIGKENKVFCKDCEFCSDGESKFALCYNKNNTKYVDYSYDCVSKTIKKLKQSKKIPRYCSIINEDGLCKYFQPIVHNQNIVGYVPIGIENKESIPPGDE